MLSLEDATVPAGSRFSRREWLRAGGLSAVGLSLADVLRAAERPAAPPTSAPRLAGEAGATFGRAKSVIFLWIQGGPPQHETFDPKPDAPVEIRGPFKPIATNVPGIRFCELLPRTARHADKLAVIRSFATRDDNHDVSGYWLLTGYPYGPGSARQIKPSDWPYFGSVVRMLKPSERLPALTSVWLPDVMRLNDNVTPAGQTAGFLGKSWEPTRFVGDPAAPDYHIEGLSLAGELTRARVDLRRGLLGQLDRHFDRLGRGESVAAWDRLTQHAYGLVTSGAARAAFDLSKENDRTRDRYGRHTWGQSCLLARRLVEAGVRLVHVNWPRDPGDNAVDNPMWDTHAQNADRLQDSLCPQFDITFDALLDDLAERGLLSETLVVAVGEFGRTPRINAQGGRDHWGHVFSGALAGAGIRGGQVIGASDRNGAYPVTDPVRGGDFTATIFHLLGIDPGGVFHDKANRPHAVTQGTPIVAALGLGPATAERCPPGGDPSFVPPYDARLLLDAEFDAARPLIPPAPPTRDKGWRGAASGGLTVNRANTPGVVIATDAAAATLAADARALVAQEIRNARGGHYTFTVQVSGEGPSPAALDAFLAQVSCRLLLVRYGSIAKDPREAAELASAEFRPEFGKAGRFTVSRFLGSTVPGANFSIGNGLGVAVVVAARPGARLNLPKERAGLRLHGVTLEFSPRARDENVTV
jgi:hypothetical protein